MEPLTSEQTEQFREQGYVLVSGLAPDSLVRAAVDAFWTGLGASPDDPATWKVPEFDRRGIHADALTACYTDRALATAAQLGGGDPASYVRPGRGYALPVFPVQAEWKWPNPHLDHAIREHGHRSIPKPFRVASMLYLTDVQSHGGATVVWPGSHRRVQALVESDPERYALMWTLNQDLERAGIGEPLEIVAKAGDILFYDCYCAHAGSMNTSGPPRLAMNAKW